MSPYTDVMNDSGGIDNSTTTMTVTNGAYFRDGDAIMVDSEKMLVTGVSGNDPTIVRSWGDPAAASHSDGATITILTRAMPEGATYTTGHTTVPTAPYNYTQIISEAAAVSKSELALTRYGIADALDYQVAKLFADGGRAGKLRVPATDLLLRRADPAQHRQRLRQHGRLRHLRDDQRHRPGALRSSAPTSTRRFAISATPAAPATRL